VLVAVGLWIRGGVHESPVFARLRSAQDVERAPVREVLGKHGRTVVLTALLRTGQQAPFYVFTTWVLTYATGSLGYPRSSIVTAVLVAAAALATGCANMSERERGTAQGAGIGAAAGGIIGALMGIGVPEADAQHFDRGVRSGGVLVTVEAGDRLDQAIAILQHNKADLGPSGIGRFQTAGAPADAVGTGDLKDEQRLTLREEQLDVQKERVQAGEVRIRKEVVTERQNINVPVSREEVVIERRPAAEVEASGTPIGDDKEIRIPLSEERVNVEKRPVVREEIDVGKRTVAGTERVSDEVRREEARIETKGKASVQPLGGRKATPYGKERRRRRDTSYAGPERREAQL
jgi:uncharacterized protein (TIGR02271 family)